MQCMLHNTNYGNETATSAVDKRFLCSVFMHNMHFLLCIYPLSAFIRILV